MKERKIFQGEESKSNSILILPIPAEVEEVEEEAAAEEEEQVVEEEPSVKKKKKKDKKKHIKEEPLSEEEPCTSTAVPVCDSGCSLSFEFITGHC